MACYRDYFGIKPDYAPIMTRESIDKSPETWLAFYPHDSYVAILRELLKCLNGGKKSLWITGAYGTGKSHASLVLQKLFTDDEVRVQEWLDLRQAHIPEVVRQEIFERRREKTLVVYDVNSDGVDGKNQFLMRLQRGITRLLRANGHTIPLRGKLEEVIERVRQDDIHFFAKRNEMQIKLSHLHAGINTADELVKKLEDDNPDPGLISDVMQVFEARQIYLDSSAEDFLSWVGASLDANGFSKLVYIWDEFSAFMDRNRSELKTMEQLAEAADQGRFYFVPVTHTDISAYVAEGSESAKKANSRFTFKRLDLPNETALKLAADIFVVKTGMEKKWHGDRDLLWDSVRGVAESYMAVNGAGIDPKDLKSVLPLHPMAAFLLKHLSVAVGANQRSMFEFLNSEDFKDFIDGGGLDVEGRQFLTVDHLWRYFLEPDDLGMDQAVQDARTEYARHEQNLQPDEQRILKAVLLFSLIEQLQGSGHPLLNAAVDNIIRSFEGDGAMLGVDAILRDLEQKHCFTIVNGRCVRFRDRADTKEIADKKAGFSGKFNELVLRDTESELVKQLRGINWGGRLDVRATNVHGLSPSSITKKENFGENGNQILVQFIFARDEQEQLLIPHKAMELAKHFNDHRMLFVALPEVNFCRDNAKAWDEFTENNARLALASDSASKKVFTTQIESAKATWYSKVKSATKLVVYKPNPQGEPFVENVTWTQLQKDWFIGYAKQTFAAYTDDLSGFNPTALGVPNSLQNWALAGMEFDQYSKPGNWKTVVGSWQKHGVSGEEAWFDANPNHPLAQLRDFCKKRQDTTVGAGNNCSIRKLFIDLQRPPFGLMGVPHSAFVLGFVLKTWLTGQRKLQWTDGVNTRPLDSTTLAEIIDVVVKDNGGNTIKNEKQICRLSKEEKTFIEQCSILFGNSPLADGTVETALNAVASRLEVISQRVPLWVLPEYIRKQNEPSSEIMANVIDALCAANSISSKGDTETRINKVKEIGGILLATPGLAKAMAAYMNPLAFADALQQYIETTKPELKEAAERIHCLPHEYCDVVKNLFVQTSGWLWKRGDIDAVLEEVYRQVLSIEHISKMSNLSGNVGFADALVHLCNAILIENKVPVDFWKKKHPELHRFFDLLSATPLSGADVKAFEETLSLHSQVVREIFFDTGRVSQFAAMREIFGEIWPGTVEENRDLYDAFPKNSANFDLQDFKTQGRNIIDAFKRRLVSTQVSMLWLKHTGTASPIEWSAKYLLPAECILKMPDGKSIIDAVTSPTNLAVERLHALHEELNKEDVFHDISTAQEKFLLRILPPRYLKIGFSADQLSAWLSQELGSTPNSWLADGRLRDAVESFVKQRYNSQARDKAIEKIRALSDTEAKSLLLKLVAEIPDVGLSTLE